MQNTRCQEVQNTWEEIQKAFKLLPSGDKEEKPGQITRKFVMDLAALFTPYFGQHEVAERLAVPEDYLYFLTLSKGTWRRGGDYGLYLYSADAVLADTSYGCDCFAENRPQDAGMWITIGHWSDRHDIMLCCDCHLSLFGTIIDCNDDHPWMANGAFYPQSVRGAPDFAHFLDYLRSLE